MIVWLIFIGSIITLIISIFLLTLYLDYTKIFKVESSYVQYGNTCIRIPNGHKLPKFTFNQFLKFYNLNPESWYLKGYTDGFLNEQEYYVPVKKDGKYHSIYFTNFYNYLRYVSWYENKHKEETVEKETKIRNEATEEFCASIQKDIDKIRVKRNEALITSMTQFNKILPLLTKAEQEALINYYDKKLRS